MIKIIDFYWERVNLYLVCDNNIKEDVYLVDRNNKIELDKDENIIKINITNTPEGEMLQNGNWLLSCKDKIILADNLINRLNEISRHFYYRNDKYAYLVDLVMNDDKTIHIKTNFMMINTKWKKFYRFNEGENFFEKVKILIKKIYLVLVNFLYHFLTIFKFSSKKNVLFLTENSDVLTGNLEVLYNSVDNKSCNKKYYAFDNFIKGNVVKKIFSYLYEIYLIAISDVIFIDNYTPKLTHIKLSKKTRLVQLWHAGVGFKAVGYARFGLTGSPHPTRSCHRNYTDVIVDQEKLIPVYQEVFGVKKDIFKILGMPRLDGYLDKDKIKKETELLYKENPKFKAYKVILFSPTYRGSGSLDAYYDYSVIDLNKIYEFCRKNKFIFVVKMHPFVKNAIEIEEKYRDLIFDYSSMDINKLIYVSDIMITDYSSCCYEYSLFDRPLIFYRFDKEIYEYSRPIHTVDMFTDKQVEVKSFTSLIKVLNNYKNIDIKERFKYINCNENNSCKEIKKIFIGENND